jgi:hypothetical protein
MDVLQWGFISHTATLPRGSLDSLHFVWFCGGGVRIHGILGILEAATIKECQFPVRRTPMPSHFWLSLLYTNRSTHITSDSSLQHTTNLRCKVVCCLSHHCGSTKSNQERRRGRLKSLCDAPQKVLAKFAEEFEYCAIRPTSDAIQPFFYPSRNVLDS